MAYTDGKESARTALATAGSDVHMQAVCDKDMICAGGADLAYVTVRLTDQEGRDNLFEQKQITVNVSGAGTLQGFGSADPQSEYCFDDLTCDTFDGYVMAVVRAGDQTGKICVSFESEGMTPVEITIDVQ